MKTTFDFNSQALPVDVTPSGNSYRISLGNQTFDVEVLRAAEGKLDLLVDGQRVTAYVSSDRARRWVTVNGQTVVLTRSSGARPRGAGHEHASELAAPMPGQVRSVSVAEGESVVKGQTLMLLEAMKMEIRIQAPRDGKVMNIFVKQGETVEREQRLIEIEEK